MLSAFIPEVWSASLLTSLKKALVYGGVANRDYEGDISGAGDTVRITSISRPTIGDYVPGSTTINPQQLVDAQRSLVIDQVKYFAFEVDDVNARQAAGNVMPEATAESAFALADVMDQFVAALYTGIQSANVVSTTAAPVDIDHSVATGVQAEQWNKVWDSVLVPLKVKLDEASVPQAGRYTIIPPWLHGALIRDSRFLQVDASGSPEAMRNGMVGRAAGFDILVSNNCPVPTANNYVITAGVPAAITMAEQINKIEAYRPPDSFSDAIKGLALYGARLIRPDSLACATVQYTA